jgi:TonB family protein
MKRVPCLLVISAMYISADSVADISTARAAMDRGDLADAEQILRAHIHKWEQKNGLSSGLDGPFDLLAKAYQRDKKFKQAADAQNARVMMWTKLVGPNEVVVGRNLGQLAIIERQGGMLAEAETHARGALAIMAAKYAGKPANAQAALDVADVLLVLGQTEEAEKILAMAQSMLESSMGQNSVMALQVIGKRITIFNDSGHASESVALDMARQQKTAAAGVYAPGGSGENQVLGPRIKSKHEPEYSEEARKKRIEGTMVLNLVVDASGSATQIAVLRPLGMGLDERAVKAVSKWKFVSGQKSGKPIAVQAQVEVTFHLL